MNKTVSINIAGIVFHIEEDAYERLKSYLDSLRMKFHAEEGRDEILADIESRIAEILTQKKGPAREVVIMKDIEEVIAMMGEPEAISDEGNNQQSESKTQQDARSEEYERRGRRRLFRDPDDKVVGGVCSGIGHYFDIDPVWIRLGFALMFFIGGTGILFYILLMIIIPRAETTAEKLEMRGDPVDVNNIRRSIKEEFDELGNRVKGFGKEARDWGKAGYDNYRHRSRYHRRGAEDFFRGMFHVIGRAFAFALVFFGVIFLIGLFTGTFFVTDFGPDLIAEQVKSLFDDGTSYFLGVLSGLLFFGVPILMMIYYGLKVLFRIQRKDKWVGITALSLWVAGIIFGIMSISNIAAGFSESSEIAERIPVMNAHDSTITISVNIDEEMINEDYHSDWNERYHYGARWKMVSTNETTVKLGTAELNIVPATGDSIELIMYKKSHGRTKEEAGERVRAIKYAVFQDSNGIVFPSAFTMGDQMWKAQEVNLELRLPVGTEIFIDATCSGLIYDIANVSNTEDRYMVDRRWKMTANGLECVDCAGLEIKKPQSQKNESDQYDNPNILNETITGGGDTMIIYH